jgi:flagellar transcriptional activator FlhD
MKSTQLLNEVREANLTYLMLAQHLLREDRETAMYRLGIGADVAELLEGLTAAQLSKLSVSSTLLCRFRCDDRMVLEALSGYGRQRILGESHAAILMSGQPAATMA